MSMNEKSKITLVTLADGKYDLLFNIFESNLKYTALIYSIDGKLISNKTLEKNNLIDLSLYPPGLYIMEIKANGVPYSIVKLLNSNL